VRFARAAAVDLRAFGITFARRSHVATRHEYLGDAGRKRRLSQNE
jgi:hypothetical protein